MSKKEIEKWAKDATWRMLSEYTVPWVATENPEGRQLAMKWISSKDPKIAATGWATYGSIAGILPDEQLDLAEIESLLKKVTSDIDKASDRVKYTMNGFVISVAAFVKPLLAKAKAAAKKIGALSIDMGDTSCKVPVAADYIAKLEAASRIGVKRKMVKC